MAYAQEVGLLGTAQMRASRRLTEPAAAGPYHFPAAIRYAAPGNVTVVAWIERAKDDAAYWAHAQAALLEGFCPDCGGQIGVRRSVAVWGDPLPPMLECAPCETEWVAVPEVWRIRCRSLAAIAAENVPRA
jgi:hypothetical protein